MRISVIITCYNRSWCIARAIDSAFVFLSGLGGGQIVVVDDASSDGSIDTINKALLRHASNKLIKVSKVFLSVNGGVCKAKNAGARAAEETWITFLDSDDELVPSDTKMFSQIVRSNSDLPLIFFRCIAPGEKINSDTTVERINFSLFVRFGTKGETLPVLRREVFLEFPYNEFINGYEGLSYLAICFEHKQIGLCDLTLRIYHTAHEGRLSSPAMMLNRAESIFKGHWVVLRTYFKSMDIISIVWMVLRLMKALLLAIVNRIFRIYKSLWG